MNERYGLDRANTVYLKVKDVLQFPTPSTQGLFSSISPNYDFIVATPQQLDQLFYFNYNSFITSPLVRQVQLNISDSSVPFSSYLTPSQLSYLASMFLVQYKDKWDSLLNLRSALLDNSFPLNDFSEFYTETTTDSSTTEDSSTANKTDTGSKSSTQTNDLELSDSGSTSVTGKQTNNLTTIDTKTSNELSTQTNDLETGVTSKTYTTSNLYGFNTPSEGSGVPDSSGITDFSSTTINTGTTSVSTSSTDSINKKDTGTIDKTSSTITSTTKTNTGTISDTASSKLTTSTSSSGVTTLDSTKLRTYNKSGINGSHTLQQLYSGYLEISDSQIINEILKTAKEFFTIPLAG